MTTYELRIHARDVSLTEGGLGDIGEHTGYDLITIHDDGTQTIQYIDLYKQDGKINFYITTTPITVIEYTLTDDTGTSRNIKWGSKTFHNGQEINTTEDYLETYQASTKTLISGDNALAVFNKIKLEAMILNQLSDKLEYDVLDRNCNTSTDYFAQKYLGMEDDEIFEGLPDATYRGSEDSFYNPDSTDTTDVTIKLVNQVLDEYFAQSDYDPNPENVQVTPISGSNGWSLQIIGATRTFTCFLVDSTAGLGNISNVTIINIADEGLYFTNTGSNCRYIGNNFAERYTIKSSNNSVYANGGNDEINIYSGTNNYVDSGSGDDEMETRSGYNYIDCGSGNDTIKVGGGNNTIIGGAGNDRITMNSSNNIIIWNRGDGFDTISDSRMTAYGFKDNLVRLGGVQWNDFYFRNDGKNYIAFLKSDPTQGVNLGLLENMEFTDEQKTYSIHNGLNLIQTDEDEVITATNGNDTIDAKDGDDRITCGSGNDTVYGGKGNDTIFGDTGDDIISGGEGDDVIYGEEGNDTYIWNLGDGLDTIDDAYGTNKIVFGEGISAADLEFLSGPESIYDAFIRVKGDPTQGIIYKNLYGKKYVTEISFADGSTLDISDIGPTFAVSAPNQSTSGTKFNDTIYGTDGEDTILGGNGNDTLIGNKGNDILNGEEGHNTYVWNIGDGLDRIRNGLYFEEDYKAEGTSTIEFGEGISFSNIKFRGQGEELFIYVNDNDSEGIIITEYRDTEHPLWLKFKDGTLINLSESGMTFHQSDDSNDMTGSLNDDIIYMGNNGGRAYGETGNNIIYGGDGDDEIKVAFNTDVQSGNDKFYGGAGDDVLSSENGNDLLVGGTGDDYLFGGEGDDIYIYNLGDGNDYISDDGGNDKIVFGEGITLDDLSFRKETWSPYSRTVYIDINKTGNIIEIDDQLSEYDNYASKIETLEFADGTSVSMDSLTSQLIQAMNSFGADTSSTMDAPANLTENVSDMCNLAAGSDLIKKAI